MYTCTHLLRECGGKTLCRRQVNVRVNMNMNMNTAPCRAKRLRLHFWYNTFNSSLNSSTLPHPLSEPLELVIATRHYKAWTPTLHPARLTVTGATARHCEYR
jgi:hypothetical protein